MNFILILNFKFHRTWDNNHIDIAYYIINRSIISEVIFAKIQSLKYLVYIIILYCNK